MISDRTTRKIVRSGDNVDSVRVASLNHWLMEERVMHKKPKRDINAQIVSGACLMTSDESFEYHVAKSKEKADKLREKELRAQAKVAKTKERQDKKVAKLVANELKRREKIELTLAAEQKQIAVAEAKAAKRIAKAEAKEAKRIDDAEAKEAKRIARAEAKNIKRVADAEAKELKRIAQAAAKEAKRIATEEKRATAANAKKARHLTTILGTETTQSTGGVLSKKRQRFDSASESRPDLELKVDTYGDFHTNGEYEITF
ncbi:hypothetical protein PR003_g33644 [Phytophthora rubi]|uniref:Uncharacterized protein n=1 Tax=Phytophthora rubi TaxID=129364 RepID=A0A6A4AQE8_9STRA|nr:hypothetical protein PR003_g33644 [Phytophthora rubi]